MMINIGQVLVLTDEEFQQEVAQRRQKLQLKEGQTVLGCPQCAYSQDARRNRPAAVAMARGRIPLSSSFAAACVRAGRRSRLSRWRRALALRCR